MERVRQIASIVFVFLALSACNTSWIIGDYSSEEESHLPYKIALFYNLEGEQAPLDVPAYKGSKLAFDLLLQDYPLLADQVGYALYDGGSNAELIGKKARMIKRRNDILGALGFSDDNMVIAAMAEIQKAEKLFVAEGATSPLLQKASPRFLFLAAFGDNAQAAAAAEYAHQIMNLKRACVLYDKDLDYTLLIARYFKESFTSWGGEIADEQSFIANSPSVAEQLEAFKKVSPPPDMIYLAANPAEAPSLIKEIRSHGFLQPIFGGDSFDTQELINSDTRLTNIYFTTHVMLDSQTTNPQINRFVNAYIAAYNEYPLSAFAALGFDAVNLFFEAIRLAHSFDPQDILKAFAQIKDFKGVSGTISYSTTDHVPIKPVTVIGIKEDRRYFKDSFIPQKVPLP